MALSTQEFMELQAYIQSLEDDNQQLQAALRDLLNNLSHDLRTPLAAIKNSLYLLGKHLDDPKRDHYLDVLNQQTNRMDQLLSDIATLSRLDSRATTFELQRLDLNRVLDTLLERYESPIVEKNHTVLRRFAPELPDVLADEVKISRAFGHLLENAIHYTPYGGHITLGTLAREEQVIVEITDNGAGISKEALPHIFDSFFREDSARSTTTGRAGLGLAIARRIIENHSGSISVESEVGIGTCFRVVFPALPRINQI